jgi:hypothetical protein
MQSEAKYFNGQYYLPHGNKKILCEKEYLSEIRKHFEIDGTVHFGENKLINIDGSFRYKGKCDEELSEMRFGVIRGHACFSNIEFCDLGKLPKIEYANLFTVWYNECFPLLKLVKRPRFDGVFRLLADENCNRTKNESKKIGEIIKKYMGKIPAKKAILDCQRELINNGFTGNASW